MSKRLRESSERDEEGSMDGDLDPVVIFLLSDKDQIYRLPNSPVQAIETGEAGGGRG